VGRFEDVLALAHSDSRISGIILGGSRGKGFETDRSDWDVYLVLFDGAGPDEMTAALRRSRQTSRSVPC